MTALTIVAASAAGWAILALAVVMLFFMDLRDGRLMVAGGWFAAAMAGGWLAVIPGLEGVAPHWVMVVLAVSLAVCGWLNFNRLLAQATSPSPWASSARYAAVGAMAGLIALLAPATASRNGGVEARPKEPPTKTSPATGARHDPLG